jgi:hypothetical protein
LSPRSQSTRTWRTWQLLALAQLACACTVPDVKIVYVRADAAALGAPTDAQPNDAGAAARADAAGGGPQAGGDAPSGMDAGATSEMRTGSGGAGSGGAGAGGAAAHGGGGAAGGGAAGEAGHPEAGGPASNPCLVWLSANSTDTSPPPAAIEGGLETTIGAPARQYICRTKPAGSDYAVPGKVVFGLGCYVTARVAGQIMQFTANDPFEVLTAGPGCAFSWQSATTTTRPNRAIDLGDPSGGGHYACSGYYTSVRSSGTQIGQVFPTTDVPPHNECYFESFFGPLQPQDPVNFQILAQDTP